MAVVAGSMVLIAAQAATRGQPREGTFDHPP
jgi:hypothetical protein